MAVVAVVVLVVVSIIGVYIQYHAFGSFITVTRSVPQNLIGFDRGVSSKWIRLVYPDNPPKRPKIFTTSLYFWFRKL